MPKAIEVSRWQAARRQWNYNAAQWFWWRIGQCAYQDALKVDADGKPKDEALLARDWFARSEPAPLRNGKREFASFAEVCHWLGLNADAERIAILEVIDHAADFDTEECDERLERLSKSNPDDDEPLYEIPEMFRVVAVRDQGSLFAA